jgi:Sporulation and spore germination
MIPRYQKVLFSVLVAGIVLMAVFLFYEHKRAQDRLAAATDGTPIAAPVDSSTEALTFDLANDADGSITAQSRQLALPEEPSVRARALLERLLAEYALPGSPHPLAGGAAVDDVFLLQLPIVSPPAAAAAHASPTGTTQPDTPQPDAAGELAVINLRGSFIDKHPSGVEVETLTLQSMLETLHANFPQITEVRFLVDGQPHDTLAGHADLTRVYPVDDTTTQGAPAAGSGDPQ